MTFCGGWQRSSIDSQLRAARTKIANAGPSGWDSGLYLPPDLQVQGAAVYRIDGRSCLEADQGAVFLEYLATGPWELVEHER